MTDTAPQNLPTIAYPKPTAQVETYVKILGVDLTIDFLLTFGGASLYIPDNPGDRSELVALIGVEKTKVLAAQKHKLQTRVPLAKNWIIECFNARGMPIQSIARKLHVSDVSVRRALATARDRQANK